MLANDTTTLAASPVSQGPLPRVSVVIPCRQESRHIRAVLESVLANTYPSNLLEILVVDGMSDDGTREIVAELAARQPLIRLMDNPRRIIPAALNRGIAAARGDVIVRMDAHTTYSRDYIERCVTELVGSGFDNVGGVCITRPGADTLLARAFAAVLSHPMGIGNAYYKLRGGARREVDAVPFGCMWRSRMLAVGPYDERMARSEDMDFTARLRALGGRLLLVPDIISYYHARSDLGSFAKHSLSNGYWVLFPLAFGRMARARHYIPLLFLLSLVLPLVLGTLWRPILIIPAVSLLAYLLAITTAAIDIGRRERDAGLGLAMLAVFPFLHLLYGVGSLAGLVAAMWTRGTRGRAA